MKLDVYIKPTHEVIVFPMPCAGAYGVISEDNSIILNIHFPENLAEVNFSTSKKELVATTSQGSFCYPLLKETFELPAEVMSDIIVKLQIKVSSTKFTWKTFPFILRLKETIDDSGNNTIQSVVDEAKEACRASLASSVSAATGDDHSGKTWDELNNTVAELPILKEEQIQELGGWELVKAYFENYRGNSHHLFNAAPKDAEGNAIPYKLPYIYTPKLRWQADILMLSTELLEVGVDVSSAVNLGGGGTSRTFSPLPKLKKLVLTGNANTSTLYNFMTTNYELEYIKMDTPSETALMANAEYYRRAFYRCERLRTIDCELDFTGQTVANDTFKSCFKLENLKIRPFTLSTSLDLGDCQVLHLSGSNKYDSLISVLNSITLDKEVAKNMTLTFSGAITDFTVGMYKFWMKDVYFYESDGLYHSKPPEVTGDEAYLETYLYDAFMNKGVTIAWK